MARELTGGSGYSIKVNRGQSMEIGQFLVRTKYKMFCVTSSKQIIYYTYARFLAKTIVFGKEKVRDAIYRTIEHDPAYM